MRITAVLLACVLVIGRSSIGDSAQDLRKIRINQSAPPSQAQPQNPAMPAILPPLPGISPGSPTTVDSAAKPADAQGGPALRRDPFSNSPTIEREFEQRQKLMAPAAAPLIVDRGMIPEIKLRGFADDGVRPPVALIELATAGVVLVHKGDNLSVAVKGGSIDLTVDDISDAGVLVKVAGREEIVVIK